jgi:DNA-binding transcriptional LysR family regulator
MFPGLLRKFAAKYPRVRVKTIEAGGIDQCELLRRGELDAAVAVREGNEAEFVAHAIPLVRFRIVYNPRSGITLNKTVEVRDLTGVPLLLLRPGFGSRRMFDAACRLERIVPDVFLESTATETLLALAREGHVLRSFRRRRSGSTGNCCGWRLSCFGGNHWRRNSPCSGTASADRRAVRKRPARRWPVICVS